MTYLQDSYFIFGTVIVASDKIQNDKYFIFPSVNTQNDRYVIVPSEKKIPNVVGFLYLFIVHFTFIYIPPFFKYLGLNDFIHAKQIGKDSENHTSV